MRHLRSARFLLFAGTGLAVPFYAFAPGRMFGKPLDAATVLAGLFVALGALAALGEKRPSRSEALFLCAALAVPLLVLLPPRPERFDPAAFGVSLAHWVLVVLFFFFGLSLDLSDAEKQRLTQLNLVLGVLIAAFALYQVAGVPRGWPASGKWLVGFQREPLRLSSVGGGRGGPGYTRPTSVFLEPAWMGGYLVWVFFLGLGLWSQLRQRAWRLALAVGLALIGVAVVASVSWGTYADAGVAGVVAVALLARSFKRGKMLAAAALLAAVFVSALVLTPPGRIIGGALRDRWRLLVATPIAGSEDSHRARDSSWIRARNLAHTLELWKGHPLKGIGLGQFHQYAPPRTKETQEWVAQTYPWCGWLTIGAEMGPAGPALLVSAILVVLSRWKRNRPAAFAWIVPVLAALCVAQQLHTGSYIDLWWWFPLTLAGALTSAAPDPQR